MLGNSQGEKHPLSIGMLYEFILHESENDKCNLFSFVVLEKRISTNQTGIAVSGRKRGVARQLNINLSQWHKIKSRGGLSLN